MNNNKAAAEASEPPGPKPMPLRQAPSAEPQTASLHQNPVQPTVNSAPERMRPGTDVNAETPAEYLRPEPRPAVSPTAPPQSVPTYPERSGFELHGRHAFERSINDLARELLHPMLKQWLDEHLASIVEKLVDKEIERLSRCGSH